MLIDGTAVPAPDNLQIDLDTIIYYIEDCMQLDDEQQH